MCVSSTVSISIPRSKLLCIRLRQKNHTIHYFLSTGTTDIAFAVSACLRWRKSGSDVLLRVRRQVFPGKHVLWFFTRLARVPFPYAPPHQWRKRHRDQPIHKPEATLQTGHKNPGDKQSHRYQTRRHAISQLLSAADRNPPSRRSQRISCRKRE